MEDGEDVSLWIDALKSGDEEAAQAIWEQYYDKLVRLARRKMEGMRRREVDEEDVALSAFNSFYQRASTGRFPQLNDRHDLWKLLVTITVRKALAHHKKQKAKKRGGAQVRGDSIFIRAGETENQGGFQQVLGKEPSPEFAAMMAETCGDLLSQLEDETLKAVAEFKMQGYSNDEIAEQLSCTTRTVERKLARIREKWSPEEPT